MKLRHIAVGVLYGFVGISLSLLWGSEAVILVGLLVLIGFRIHDLAVQTW